MSALGGVADADSGRTRVGSESEEWERRRAGNEEARGTTAASLRHLSELEEADSVASSLSGSLELSFEWLDAVVTSLLLDLSSLSPHSHQSAPHASLNPAGHATMTHVNVPEDCKLCAVSKPSARSFLTLCSFSSTSPLLASPPPLWTLHAFVDLLHAFLNLLQWLSRTGSALGLRHGRRQTAEGLWQAEPRVEGGWVHRVGIWCRVRCTLPRREAPRNHRQVVRGEPQCRWREVGRSTP